MRHNAIETIQRYNMLPRGSRVVAGFSGGADSVALLSFLWELRQKLDLTVVACHVNHQLRGEEAQRDEAFCRNFCRERGIELAIFRENVREGAKEAGQSVEEYARELRYRHFGELLSSESDRIATAHNANDLAETVLFHLARGTGLKGLVGIPPVRGQIIRPLLYCSRAEIENYCMENKLDYITDSSNLTDEYTRNRIRHHLLPMMEEINPAFVKSAIRLSKQAQLEEDYLEKQLFAELASLALGENQWSREEFLRLHPAMQKRMAAFWLEKAGAECSGKKIDDVLALIARQGTLELHKGYFLQVEEKKIRLKQALKQQPFFSVTMKTGENALFEGKKLLILPINREKYKFFANNQEEDLKNALDYDKIDGIAEIRQRKPGDSIQLAGFTKARSFKKLLNQRKIPIEERSRLAVLCDEKGPVWLEGFGVRADALPDEKSSNIILIRVLKEL